MWLPTRLALNSLTAGIAARLVRKYGQTEVSARDLRHVIKAIHRARRFHRDWYLVDAEDAAGDKVTIKL